MSTKERQICLIAHNIRSLWNIGSLFRTSDAFNIKKIYLTGYTATPPRREITKTAIGAEQWVDWEYQKDSMKVINFLKNDGWTIVGLELTDDAIHVSEYESPKKVALLLGHEVTGIPQEQLDACDQTIMIPMLGKKESLNVTVAAGIALHTIRIS